MTERTNEERQLLLQYARLALKQEPSDEETKEMERIRTQLGRSHLRLINEARQEVLDHY